MNSQGVWINLIFDKIISKKVIYKYDDDSLNGGVKFYVKWCDFFSENNIIKSNITSFIKFINLGTKTISYPIEKVLVSNDLEFIEILLNTICNNNISTILLKTSNPELIKLILSNSDWHPFFNLGSLIDTIINDSIVCNNFNSNTDSQTIELIEIINFLHSKSNDQTKIFRLGFVTILSYQATNTALLKKKSINILQLFLKYNDLFYWDSKLFPNLPNLPDPISISRRSKIKNQSLLINTVTIGNSTCGIGKKEIIQNDDGVDLIIFKYLFSHRFLEKLDKTNLLRELLDCAIEEDCFHLCSWLLSTDSPLNVYVDELFIKKKLSFSSSPVFKEYMNNKLNNTLSFDHQIKKLEIN
ncbi:hypothetical protein ACTFIY_008245 [Dictyostelium cf. discoideum]